MKILVTGAAGFIGFHVCSRLLDNNIEVVGLDNINDYYDTKLKYDRLQELGVTLNKNKVFESKNNLFTFVKGNLEDNKLWDETLVTLKVSHVIHLAAQAGVRYSLENPRSYISSNINGFLNVLEFCRNTNISKLLYASSSSVYGMNSEQPFSEDERCDKPVSLYAATKRANEMMAHTYNHLYNIDSVGLRFFTVYGPWGRPDMAPMLFTDAAFSNRAIKVFNHGNQSRDFTYIDDIVSGIISLFEKREKVIKGAKVYNIGNGSPVDLMEFIKEIENATGNELEKEFVEAQPGDVAITYADTSLLSTDVNYNPSTKISEGVHKFVTWYKNYYNI